MALYSLLPIALAIDLPRIVPMMQALPTFSVGDVMTIVSVVFFGGALWQRVRDHGDRIQKVEEKLEAHESKFLEAIHGLSKSIDELGSDLKQIVTRHETEIEHLKTRPQHGGHAGASGGRRSTD